MSHRIRHASRFPTIKLYILVLLKIDSHKQSIEDSKPPANIPINPLIYSLLGFQETRRKIVMKNTTGGSCIGNYDEIDVYVYEKEKKSLPCTVKNIVMLVKWGA